MKVGIIGAGNMGQALIRGFLLTNALPPKNILVAEKDPEKAKQVKRLGATPTTIQELAKNSDVIIIAVKPANVKEVLEELKPAKNKLLISIAAGISTSFIEKNSSGRAIRVMPNLCAGVGEMAACYSLGKRAGKKDEEVAKKLFSPLGLFLKIDEKLMDAVTGVSGSGPAFLLHVIQAMAAAGKEAGLPEEVSLKLAAQTAIGAGVLAISSESSPEEIIQKICTPKGTTIEGMKVLEERKVAEAVKGAVEAAIRRARELSAG
ncbi:MAG: pyrroline-5-carboxylate reductase [Candidatus Hadarchaeales archaeon]